MNPGQVALFGRNQDDMGNNSPQVGKHSSYQRVPAEGVPDDT